jgi:ankyrin repeat protein
MYRHLSQARAFIPTLLVTGLLLPVTLLSQQSELLDKVRSNDLEAVKALVAAGVDLNEREEFYHMTPLILACNSNYTEVAKVLIEGGANIHLQADNGATALIMAAMNSLELTELLLAKGADINARSNNGTGAFTNCTMGIISGRVGYELAELLLAKGAEIDELNTTDFYSGYTPLFWAVYDNNESLVKFLIEHGANVNATAKNAKTPLSLATESGYENIAKLLKTKGGK